MISIGDLAARAGVSVRALRYYEQQDLLRAGARNARGHREYPESAVERVRTIQELYAAGLSSHSIAAICPHEVAEDLARTGRAAQPTGECLALLQAERERMDSKIEELTEARARLVAVIDSSVGTRLSPAS